MGFFKPVIVPDVPVFTRFYPHSFGFDEYGGYEGGIEHIQDLFEEYGPELNRADYLISSIYIYGEKIAEFIGGKIDDDPEEFWNTNAEVLTFVFKDGVYIPEESNFACEDFGQIVFRNEVPYRRRVEKKQFYTKAPADETGFIFDEKEYRNLHPEEFE